MGHGPHLHTCTCRSHTRGHGLRITQVEGRVDTVEGVLGVGVPRPAPRLPPAAVEHREAAIVARRQKSDADLENASTVGGMIAHTKKLEEAYRSLESTVSDAQRRQDETNGAQDAALVILARELGVESKLPPRLLQSLPPAKPSSAPPPPPVLGRLEQRAKSSQIVQLLIALSVIADLVKSILFPHQ